MIINRAIEKMCSQKNLESACDDEIDVDFVANGIGLSYYYIENESHDFLEYARVMLEQLGGKVKPYLKSWYLAVKHDPHASKIRSVMDTEDFVVDVDIDDLEAEVWWSEALSFKRGQELRVLPALVKALEAAFELGYCGFKDASRFVLKNINNRIGGDVINRISLTHLQAAYIVMSLEREGEAVDDKYEVFAINSMDELLDW